MSDFVPRELKTMHALSSALSSLKSTRDSDKCIDCYKSYNRFLKLNLVYSNLNSNNAINMPLITELLYNLINVSKSIVAWSY